MYPIVICKACGHKEPYVLPPNPTYADRVGAVDLRCSKCGERARHGLQLEVGVDDDVLKMFGMGPR